MSIKPVLVPDHTADDLRRLMDSFAEASTGPTKRQLTESRAAVAAAQGVTEGFNEDILDKLKKSWDWLSFKDEREGKQETSKEWAARYMKDLEGQRQDEREGKPIRRNRAKDEMMAKTFSDRDERDVDEGMAEQQLNEIDAIQLQHLQKFSERVSQMTPAELEALNQYIMGVGLGGMGAVAGTIGAYAFSDMFMSVMRRTMNLAKKKTQVDAEEVIKLQRQIISIHKRLKTLKSEPAIAKYQNMLKQAYEVLDELEARQDNKVAEGKKRSDRYHIVGKDGNPASLASYADQVSAAKDRDAKHPGAEVRQVGPRGKIKGVSEGIMDTVKQAFNDNVAAWPMGTSDEQFIKSWADDIRDRTGRDIPAEKLARLYQDYTRRSPDVMQSHGTTNESPGAYDKWDPKHPDFVKNYRKFQAQNPGASLADFIADLKKGVTEAGRPDVMRHTGDKTVRVVKKGGKPIGEIGIDAGPGGNGDYYVKLYDGTYDAAGFDTAEEALAELRYAIKQMSEGSLTEFAPSDSGDGGGDDDGFDEATLRKLAAQWFAGDEDPQVERLLAAAGWEIGQDEGYDDEPGVFVVMSGDDDGRSYISWPAEELRSAMSEGVSEDAENNPVVNAITRRIMLQRTDLLSKYGPEKIGTAVDEVADFVGDVEEIGSSDVSGWVRHVEQMLGNRESDVTEQQVDELSPKTLGSYIKKSSADAAERTGEVSGRNQFGKGAEFAVKAFYGDRIQPNPTRTDPRIAKRQAGVDQAVDRLTAEDVAESRDPIEQLRADIRRFAR